METRALHTRHTDWPGRGREGGRHTPSNLTLWLQLGASHLRTVAGGRGGWPWQCCWGTHWLSASLEPLADSADLDSLAGWGSPPPGGLPSPDHPVQSHDLRRTPHWLPGWLLWQCLWQCPMQKQQCWCVWNSTEGAGCLDRGRGREGGRRDTGRRGGQRELTHASATDGSTSYHREHSCCAQPLSPRAGAAEPRPSPAPHLSLPHTHSPTDPAHMTLIVTPSHSLTHTLTPTPTLPHPHLGHVPAPHVRSLLCQLQELSHSKQPHLAASVTGCITQQQTHLRRRWGGGEVSSTREE